MDLQILYFAFIFSIFIFMAHKIVTKKSDSTPNLPPGPWKLPVIGNIHNLAGSSLPHHRLRDLAAKYGPLMYLKLGEVPTIVVSSSKYAREVLKTHDLTFASRPIVLAPKIMGYDSLDIAFAPYGDYWRQLKKIFALELLCSKRVQSFQPIREEVFSNFIKRVASEEGSPINLTEEVMSALFTTTSRTAVGKKCRHHEKLIEVVKDATEVAGGFDLADLYPSAKWLQHISGTKSRLEKLHQKADNILQMIISEHREFKSRAKEEQGEEVGEALLDVLLKGEFCLSDDSIKAQIWDIFGGGSDTSSVTITWAMAEMIRNPSIMKRVQAEVREVFKKEGKPNESGLENLKYLKCVVKETLRLHPPGPLLLPRECGQACEIKGYHIPMKSKVMVNVWAIARDPEHWNEPERFYPERFMESSIDYRGNNFEFLPFGSGRRMCPGLTFGVLNVEYALALLTYHFDWKLPNGMKSEDLDMSEVFGITVRQKDDLVLIPKTFHP
ncbi:cytochrome P450 71D9-like [Abrus precatorius]|uniref:Cytochrome P450 71D9-like n=1 Tax=Abrus precatorius TaxID=3816 RepID=A0A8B8KIV3_ABRPR|nr:cytochrome P450 71D9-like [Abrus precatorius]